MSAPLQPPKPRRSSRWLVACLVVLGVAAAVSLAAMVQMALAKLSSGHGLDTYRTFWLVEFNWVVFLAFMACCLVAIAAGLVARVVQVRGERAELQELERLGTNHERGA